MPLNRAAPFARFINGEEAATVDGATAASDAARLDFGGRYALNAQMALFANATAELSNRGQSVGGTVGLKWVW